MWLTGQAMNDMASALAARGGLVRRYHVAAARPNDNIHVGQCAVTLAGVDAAP